MRKTGERVFLHTKAVDCWKCGEKMTVAWATTRLVDGSDGSYLRPDDFDGALRVAAEEKGAIIREAHSKTTGEVYDACFCGKCGAFCGERFLFSLVYCEDETTEVIA